MKLVTLFYLAVSTLAAQSVRGPYTAAITYVSEIHSVAYQTNSNQISVPIGYQMRVLRVYGSITAWSLVPNTMPVNHLTLEFSLSPAGFPASGPAASCGDSCFLHLAYTIDNGALNQPFDFHVVNGLLISALPNSAGVMDEVTSVTFSEQPNDQIGVHAQMTLTMVYQFESVTSSNLRDCTVESCTESR